VTDTNVNTSPADDSDDGLFDAAADTFPGRVHLRDRLVVIYPDGESGQRPGSNGKPYTWYSSTTVVLDDGPEGWQAEVRDDDGDLVPNLVPSVADEGPQVLNKFQWSASGIATRMAQKLPDAKTGVPGSILGRINAIKNKDKGKNPPWSIAKPTEADMETARQYRDTCKAARDAITADRLAKQDSDAF
jgi:hypothetical protein